MRHRAWVIPFATLIVAALIYSAGQADENDTKKPALPPLIINRDKPLLLDDPPTEPKKHASGADNSACFVCHTNYEEEPMARWHAEEDVGCVDCHGKSFAHRNDEDNITPPDTMFPLDKIDKACKKCHGKHKASAVDVIARWQKRCPEKTNPLEIVCTDCHGQHRLKIRTVRWNKQTGELIVGAQKASK